MRAAVCPTCPSAPGLPGHFLAGLTTRNTRGPPAALLSTWIHLLDMALLKPTLPLGSCWGRGIVTSAVFQGHLHPNPSLGPSPGPYHELTLHQALERDASKHTGLMAALPGNLLTLGSQLPALGRTQLSLNDLQGNEWHMGAWCSRLPPPYSTGPESQRQPQS